MRVNGIRNRVTRCGGPSDLIFGRGLTLVCDNGHIGAKKADDPAEKSRREAASCRNRVKHSYNAAPERPAERKRGPAMRPQRDDHLPPITYGSMSLEQIQEGVSAEAVSYAAGLLVEAIRNYDSTAFNSAHQKLTLTEAQMIAANLIAKTSAHLDDATLEEQVARVRKAIREVKP